MFQKGNFVTVLDVPMERRGDGPTFVPQMQQFVGGTYRIAGIIGQDDEAPWYYLAGDDHKNQVSKYVWDESWLAPIEEAPENEDLSGMLDALYGGL